MGRQVRCEGSASFRRVLHGVILALVAVPLAHADEGEAPSTTDSALVAAAAVGANWAGPYFGANWGGASGTSNWSSPTGTVAQNTPRFPASGDRTGIFAGATGGWNYQTGPWVGGVEGDVDVSDIGGHAICGGIYGVGGSHWYCNSRTDLLASVTGRAGFAVENLLLFAKGGVALAHDDDQVGTAHSVSGIYSDIHVDSPETHVGWVAGAGLEFALSSQWSAKAEYNHYQFGGATFSGLDNLGNRYGASVGQSLDLVKFGLNRRFGDEASDVSAPDFGIGDDFSGEIGARAGWTGGKFAKKLYDPVVRNQLNSRLTWAGQDGTAIEAFGRVDHVSGIFVKGLFGGMELSHSTMHDEDFPPGARPYSNTVSATKDGHDIYSTIDLGYDVFREPSWRLGPFVGYNYYEQHLNAYGCNQTMSNTLVCPAGQIQTNELTLSQAESWNSVRLGLAGDGMLAERLKLSGDLAWLPYSSFRGIDNHWLRPDINPQMESASGDGGFQLEGALSYGLSDSVSLGVGARYWSFVATGHTQFPGVSETSPERFVSNRTFAFAQISYAFGKARIAAATAPE